MILIKNSAGGWVRAAGNGKAEYGASTVRTGKITTEEIGIGSYAIYNVEFGSPMPDDDYHITWDWNTAGGNITFAIVTITEKTRNGFKMYVRNSDVTANPLTSHELKWFAFRLYTDTEYDSLLDSVHKNIADKVTVSNSAQHLLISCDFWTRDNMWFVGLRDKVLIQNTNVTFTIDLGNYLTASSTYKGAALYGRSGASGTPALNNRILKWTPDTNSGANTKYDLDVVFYGEL